MKLVPVRSYRINLKVRKVREGKLEFFYEEELEREELQEPELESSGRRIEEGVRRVREGENGEEE